MGFKNKLITAELENKWQKIWSDLGIYKWDQTQPRDNVFSIDTPPPTVSGHLHMGHVFSYTQADFIARFQRMNGKSVFYPIGFDDNGLPTEKLVEKEHGVKAKDIGRDNFIQLCAKTIIKAEESFRIVFKSLGISFDWSQEYQTISSRSRKISQMSFIDLYNKGKIVRKFGPHFWDSKDQTAISQAENIDKEQHGILNYIKIFTIDKQEEIVIATTRPEMLAACVAIFYHPEDDRYTTLRGKKALLPIYQREVPILTDSAVDLAKGTGLVMCCTFGDIQDVEWWRKHNLQTIECINLLGKMKNSGFLDNLKILDARDLIISRLKSEDILIKQIPIIQNIKCAERSGELLEIIPTNQWYVEILPYKKQLHTKNNQCNWYPKFMKTRLTNWIEGLNQDWCISRQRYFGVPFPVWYSKRKGEEGKVILANIDKLPVDPYIHLPEGYRRDEVEAEKDVMDTWATSALTPQLSSHAINHQLSLDKERHQKLFPYDLRPQAHEIIRTWAFSTIVKSFFHQDSIPWKNLMISGWCLSENKQKMSKSQGKSITPEKVIKQYGADVVRYWASSSKLGMDITYDNQLFRIGQRLINKLWNAGRFVFSHIEDIQLPNSSIQNFIKDGHIVYDLDKWILSRLYMVLKTSTELLEKYEYYDARIALENFFWKDFCDNYLELMKTRVYNENKHNSIGSISAKLTLYFVFECLLKLFSPFIPHITEELNSIIYRHQSSIINSKDTWPKIKDFYFDNTYIILGNKTLIYLELIRKYKSLHGLSLKTSLGQLKFSGSNLSDFILEDLKNAANCKIISYTPSLESYDLQSNCGNYSIKIVSQI